MGVTGFSTPLGHIAIGLVMLTALVVLLYRLWTDRRR